MTDLKADELIRTQRALLFVHYERMISDTGADMRLAANDADGAKIKAKFAEQIVSPDIHHDLLTARVNQTYRLYVETCAAHADAHEAFAAAALAGEVDTRRFEQRYKADILHAFTPGGVMAEILSERADSYPCLIKLNAAWGMK